MIQKFIVCAYTHVCANVCMEMSRGAHKHSMRLSFALELELQAVLSLLGMGARNWILGLCYSRIYSKSKPCLHITYF